MENKMCIEIGKVYKTRNGNFAIVEREHNDEPVYPFYGKCFDANWNFDRIAYWTNNGSYSVGCKSGFDIKD